MADTQYSILVNDAGKITYPKNFIENNNLIVGGTPITSELVFNTIDKDTGVITDRSSQTTISSNSIKSSYIRNNGYWDNTNDIFDDHYSELSPTLLNIGAFNRNYSTISLYGNPAGYEAQIAIKHSNYTSDFNFFCGKQTGVYDFGSDMSYGRMFLSNNDRRIEFADGTYDKNSQEITYDPLGMSLKFTNPALNVTQAPIYGFTSANLSSNANKDKFVYTAKAVEDRLASISSTGGETFTGGIIPNPIKIGEFNEDGTPVDRTSYAILSPTKLHIGDYKYGSDYEYTDITPSKINLRADYYSYDCNININARGSYGDASTVTVKLGGYGDDQTSTYSMFSMSNGGYGKFDFTDLDKIEEIDDYSVATIYNKYCGFKAIGLKFDNETEGLGSQQRIYAFLSNNIANWTTDIATKNGTVYTVAGVENYVKDCGFFKAAAPVEFEGRYTVGYSDITSTGYVQAFSRGSDNEGIRVLGNSTYHCEKSIATIGSGSCPMDFDFYDAGSNGNGYQQAYVSVSSDSGANIVIADNKIQLPVYNQDGTLAKNGNIQEYVAIKAVKDAATGMVSLVVMQ